jgi:broad specificity phosphatase PhoE
MQQEDMNTTLYVIRHGETEWNATGRWQGLSDVPLNEAGRVQARHLARRMTTTGPRPDAIYSSDLSRAFETAQIAAAALGLVAHPRPALREIDIGVWSGMYTQDIFARFGDELARIDAGEDLKRGGAESFGDLKRRIAPDVEALIAQHPGQALALFTHGGCVRALLAYAQEHGAELPTPYRGHIGNTSITVITRTATGWQIGTINDTTHLRPHEQEAQTPDDAEAPSEHQV